ncbi:cell division protein FtsQ/DivIB [Synechococcus sp. GFB01]|uniref:cell division protein FtsQ/DivIB n=1 Tax=Synechococcus sp. GFB01 TaxID=1662190 RepID=UPI00064FB96C|nr:FtsQ-type POTRA domain-containing protein [Synechococcus sp. GFB01]KMM18018.1 cell division protein FtsQ [Synechococcus sp. GFB01]
MTGAVRPPGVERRRLLRQQRRRERLRNLWRLLVLLALSGGLGYALLRQGWSLTNPGQVEVVGSRQVGPEQVIQAAELSFPVSLLTLQPRRLAADLTAALPVEQVQVSRLMAPPRLRVVLVDRHAVARAQRVSNHGLEMGYVDRLGNWMSSRQGQNLDATLSSSLLVRGWTPRQRPSLALVLNFRQRLGDDLREIRFEPDGNLWLRSEKLGQVRLGPPDQQLPRRLDVLEHLVKELPTTIKGRQLQSIDLSDPEQPELGVVGGKPPKPAAP